MNNKSNLVAISIVAIVAVASISIFAISRNGDKKGDMMKTTNRTGTTKSESPFGPDMNSSEYKQYSKLVGEDYDKMFLASMIAHHEGAIEMAKLAVNDASHQELKDLANAIITAQNTEIASMESWQKAWGYPASNGTMMMDHSAMGMMDDMSGMMQSLVGKKGSDFDKAFLEQMIIHHQSALNMAATGSANAKHQELKDLTVAIVTAQTKEIKQMKQWQKSWVYTD